MNWRKIPEILTIRRKSPGIWPENLKIGLKMAEIHEKRPKCLQFRPKTLSTLCILEILQIPKIPEVCLKPLKSLKSDLKS